MIRRGKAAIQQSPFFVSFASPKRRGVRRCAPTFFGDAANKTPKKGKMHSAIGRSLLLPEYGFTSRRQFKKMPLLLAVSSQGKLCG